MRPSLRKELTETFVQKWAFKCHRNVLHGVWSCPITAFQMNQRQSRVIVFLGHGLRLFGRKEKREQRVTVSLYGLLNEKWHQYITGIRVNKLCSSLVLIQFCFLLVFFKEIQKIHKNLYFNGVERMSFASLLYLAFVQLDNQRSREFFFFFQC